MRLLQPYAASASSAIAAASLLAFLGFPSPAAAKGGKGSWNCEALADGVKFDFNELKGLHQVSSVLETEDGVSVNSTWQINPCGPIQYPKGTDKHWRCAHGTQICGIETRLEDEGYMGIRNFPVAEGNVDPTYTRLKGSDSSAEADREGVRVVLEGTKAFKRPQKAIIEFLCDRDRDGNEGAASEGESGADSDTESDTEEQPKRRREEQEDGDKDDDDNKDGDGGEGDGESKKPQGDASLRFISYEAKDDKTDVLRLEWRTRYACEDGGKGDGEDEHRSKSSHWGFFTWFIIILFLGVAAYLIFGSWLNYNRYGSRGYGWDLLPHGDTIRDLPYLLKDWIRRVIGTLQGRGGGARGGYSAV